MNKEEFKKMLLDLLEHDKDFRKEVAWNLRMDMHEELDNLRKEGY